MILKGDGDRVMFVLPRGALLVESITRYAAELDLKGGLISGLGALMNVQLGYYHLEEKNYHRKTFSEMDYELISLTGNFTQKDGKHFTHVHAALGDDKFQVFGGHLFEAEVAVTVEVSVIPLGKLTKRGMDQNLGLATICGFAE
jgi:uncharacterized protein